MSSRPDLDKKVLADLAKEPIAVVRRVLSIVPKTTVKLNAADDAAATRGADQKDESGVSKLSKDQADHLDRRMGLVKSTYGVQLDGNVQTLGAPVSSARKEG